MQNVTGIDIGNVSDILYYQINTDTALHQYVILHKNILYFFSFIFVDFYLSFLVDFSKQKCYHLLHQSRILC